MISGLLALVFCITNNTGVVTGFSDSPYNCCDVAVTNQTTADIRAMWNGFGTVILSNGVAVAVVADPEPAAVVPIYTRDLATGKLVGLVVSNGTVTVYPAQNSPYTITADLANRGVAVGKLPRVFDKATNFWLNLNPAWSNVLTRADLTNENLFVQWQSFCSVQINTNQVQAASATNQTQAVTFINKAIDWLQRYNRGTQFLDRLQP